MSNPERRSGWRKRIGLLSPTVIETAADDFYRLAPDGVSMSRSHHLQIQAMSHQQA